MKNESISTKKIVMTAFFAAIIYLGIQSFRIPLPAAVGTPFLHFGHIFVMLAVLMLGPKLSTVAGVLGLLVFDVLNGYIQAIPNVFVSTIIKCLLVGMIFQSLKKKRREMRRRNMVMRSSVRLSTVLRTLSRLYLVNS